MEQLIQISGTVAPLMHSNIDTDLLIPSREMTGTGKEGYGEKLFAPWRYRLNEVGDRVENADFILNKPAFRNAKILLAGENFGSGSSREAAVWAVRQFGFRCVIAASFATIFRNNCYQNGVLPIVLTEADIEILAAEARGGTLEMTVNLATCQIGTSNGRAISFEVPSNGRTMLLEGLDPIAITLKHQEVIEKFQLQDRLLRPWVWNKKLL